MSIKVKVNKTEAGANKILEALKAKDKLSVADIMELLNVNRQSVYNYIKRLSERGIKLSSEISGHTVLYSLARDEKHLTDYEAMDTNVLRSFVIVRKLQQKPMAPKNLIKELNVKTKAEKSAEDDFYDSESDLGRTQFDKLIRGLLEKGVLTQVDKRAVLYPSGNIVPVLVNLSQDEFWDLCDKLESVAPGNPFYADLRSVYNKLCVLGAEAADTNEEIYHIYGKKYSQFNNVKQALDKLPLQSCVSRIVRYFYKSSKTDKVSSIDLATGLIVYSTDKDKIYILGKQENRSGKIYNGHRVIRLDSVEKVEVTDRLNKYWNSKEFLEIFEAMYSIASETNKEKVVIEFDNIGNIKNKLENLLFQRKSAKLSCENNKIIYTDIVMGLPDVVNYLRQFGKSCRVLEPANLKALMENSVAKSLEAYEKYEKEDKYGSIL